MTDAANGRAGADVTVPTRWIALAANPDPAAVVEEAVLLARRTRDWKPVLDVARAQALGPALERLLAALPQELVAPACREALYADRRGRIAWCAVALAELDRVVSAFEAQGIRTLVLKGPALAVLLHGDVAARPYGDLDLLVAPARRGDASRVLEALGYDARALRPAGPDSVLRLRRSVAWPGPHGVDVDLHWGFDEGGLRLDLGRRAFPPPTARVVLEGRACETLADEPLLLYLAVHGAKHLWQRRLWLADLARWIHVRPALDWDAVRTLARRAGASRILASALLLAERLAGAAPPDDVRAWAAAQPAAMRLAALHAARLDADLSGRLPSEPGASVGPWRWIALDLAQLERPRDRARGLLAWFLEVSDPGWDGAGDVAPPRLGRLRRVLRYLVRDARGLVTPTSRPPSAEGA